MRRGFSLLEALVALVIGSMVTAGVALAFRTGLDASRRLRERTEAHAEGRAVLDELVADLGAAYLSGANRADTFFQAMPPELAQDEPFLSLTTLSFRRSRGVEIESRTPRSDAVRVEYLLQIPSEGAEETPAVLVRRASWLTEAGQGEIDVLCERVAGLRVRYFDGSEFRETWDAVPQDDPKLSVTEGEDPGMGAERELPQAVEITLLLAPGREDQPGQPPRVYRTVVKLRADTPPPFEPEIVLPPPPNQGQGDGGEGTGGGPPPGGPARG